jgi:hypothetical protein
VIGTPCPTTLLTLGLLFWARPPLPRLLLAVPLLWSAVGTTAAFALGVPQDLALLVAGLAAQVLLRRPRRRPGGWKGKMWIADDFDAPLPEDLLRAFEGGSDRADDEESAR